MKYLTLFIIMAILAIYVIKRIRESFMETSYYYEAAPGARGSRLICMPEARGTASLGIDVNSAASKAVNSCAPLTMTYTAPKPKRPRIPTMCLQYMGSGQPVQPVRMPTVRYPINSGTVYTTGGLPVECPRGTAWNGQACVAVATTPSVQCPVGMAWDGTKCRVPSALAATVRPSPGCPAGMVWDGKKCKVPSALAKPVRTSPGCRTGMVWDGKKCKVPSAIRAAIRDPSRPKTPKKVGKSIGSPDGKIKYRKVKGGTFPFMLVNGKWVQAKKVNGKWTLVKVTKKSAKSKSKCGSGKKWDSKKKKCVKKN